MISSSHVIQRGDLVDRVLSTTFDRRLKIGNGGYASVFQIPGFDAVAKIQPIAKRESSGPLRLEEVVLPDYLIAGKRVLTETTGVDLSLAEAVRFKQLETELQVNYALCETFDDPEHIAKFHGGFYAQGAEMIYQVLLFEKIKAPRLNQLICGAIDRAALRESLGASNEGYGVVPLDDFYRIISQLIDVAEMWGDEDIVHRDLKPENIFWDGEQVTVIDFGLARMRGTWSTSELAEQLYADREIAEYEGKLAMGTFCYISPEVARGRYHPNTDLWSIGAIGFELLTREIKSLYPCPVEEVLPHQQAVFYSFEIARNAIELYEEGIATLPTASALSMLLDEDPEERMTYHFLQEAQRMISS